MEKDTVLAVHKRHWTGFIAPMITLALTLTLCLAKTRPPGVLLTSLPVTTVSEGRMLMAAEWIVLALVGLASLRKMIRLSRERILVTATRVIRVTPGGEAGYLEIRDLKSAAVAKGSLTAKTSGSIDSGTVVLKTPSGTIRVRGVDRPRELVETIRRLHDGEQTDKPAAPERREPAQAQSGPSTGNGRQDDGSAEGTPAGENPEDVGYKPAVRDPMEELDSLIGLESVKAEVRSLRNFIAVQRMRDERGMRSAEISLHTVFTGNPGTGKTTVARIVAAIFKEAGLLPKGHLVETDRSGLVAEFVGQTAVKTNETVDKAMGGVLFIDEAYSLTEGGPSDFGNEAIATLIKRMEDDRGRFAVILAGYTDNMRRFMDSNPGLSSRFPRTIEFPDYTAPELEEIFLSMADRNGYTLSPEGRETLRKRMEADVKGKGRDFGNGRHARNLFERAIQNHADRMTRTLDPTDDQLAIITDKDLC